MHLLITGGAGFVGSHLADHLLEQGHEVTIIDNLSTGSIRNIVHLKTHERFHYVIADVNERRLLAELVDNADAIFHLAAAVGVKLIVEDPVRTIETNIKCTEIIFELASKKKKKVLLTSTSEVYGKSSRIPFKESGDLVLGPTSKGRWSYAASKAVDEFLALAYWRQYGLPTCVVRLFNTVGPRQTGRYGMVVPRFVAQALKGEPITVYGDGTQARCFAHVRDVVEAMTLLIQTDVSNGQIFNIGSQQEISIHELALKVREMAGSGSPIVFVPYEEAYEDGFEDMPRRVPDLTHVRGAIGYQPKRNLDRILQDIIDDRLAKDPIPLSVTRQ
jgi:UDP-glucose 4-epimerase